MNLPSASDDAANRAAQAAVFFVLFAATSFVPVCRFWPLLWLVPGVLFALFAWMIPALRISLSRFNFGSITKGSIVVASLVAACSVIALTAFQHFTHPVLIARENLLPLTSLSGELVAGIVFCVVNASIEEAVFRGLLFDALEVQWGRWFALVVSSAIFGYGHMKSYPPGMLGAVLAGIYGCALAWLRLASGGFGLPILTHIVADAMIFSIFVFQKQ